MHCVDNLKILTDTAGLETILLLNLFVLRLLPSCVFLVLVLLSVSFSFYLEMCVSRESLV